MTIAACFVTPGGVVLGADSTTTFRLPDHSGNLTFRHFDHAQKLFQVGEDSSLGIVTWGLGGLGHLSYRTVFAQFADSAPNTAASLEDAAAKFSQHFWRVYSESLADTIDTVARLRALAERTPKQEAELVELIRGSTVGFCLGGYVQRDRTPGACAIIFSPDMTASPVPGKLIVGRPSFWGIPDITKRLMFGIDEGLLEAIAASEHWTGTVDDLVDLAKPFFFQPPDALPIREAIDFVDSAIYATVKGMKFSNRRPFCGGPVELAVITTDRRFRWVSHKTMNVAVG